MADEIEIDGIKYISSKRASQLSGYAQDYIGQLARGGYIDARRVGGLWHVSLESLQGYEKNAIVSRPKPPERVQMEEPDSLISFDGKDYVSAARAAKVTGYHQDYVGQLARNGTIGSRQIGNRWYVDREGIISHKAEKDRLLGAVQSQSVGISRPDRNETHQKTAFMESSTEQELQARSDIDDREAGPYLTYTNESADLMPYVKNQDTEPETDEVAQAIPIKVRNVTGSYRGDSHIDSTRRKNYRHKSEGAHGMTIFYKTFAILTVPAVILISATFFFAKDSAFFARTADSGVASKSGLLAASAGSAFSRLGDSLESLLVRDLVYIRSK